MSLSLSCRVTTHKDDGAIIEDVGLRRESGNYGVDIPKNVWHMVEALEAGGGRVIRTQEVNMRSKRIIALVKGLWAFCSYVFIPQRRPKDYQDR